MFSWDFKHCCFVLYWNGFVSNKGNAWTPRFCEKESKRLGLYLSKKIWTFIPDSLIIICAHFLFSVDNFGCHIQRLSVCAVSWFVFSFQNVFLAHSKCSAIVLTAWLGLRVFVTPTDWFTHSSSYLFTAQETDSLTHRLCALLYLLTHSLICELTVSFTALLFLWISHSL